MVHTTFCSKLSRSMLSTWNFLRRSLSGKKQFPQLPSGGPVHCLKLDYETRIDREWLRHFSITCRPGSFDGVVCSFPSNLSSESRVPGSRPCVNCGLTFSQDALSSAIRLTTSKIGIPQ